MDTEDADEGLDKAVVQSFIEHPCFIKMQEIYDAQVKHREKALLMPSHMRHHGEGEVQISDEFLKGEVSGLRLGQQLPEILLEMANMDEQEAQEEGENTRTSVDTEDEDLGPPLSHKGYTI